MKERLHYWLCYRNVLYWVMHQRFLFKEPFYSLCEWLSQNPNFFPKSPPHILKHCSQRCTEKLPVTLKIIISSILHDSAVAACALPALLLIRNCWKKAVILEKHWWISFIEFNIVVSHKIIWQAASCSNFIGQVLYFWSV